MATTFILLIIYVISFFLVMLFLGLTYSSYDDAEKKIVAIMGVLPLINTISVLIIFCSLLLDFIKWAEIKVKIWLDKCKKQKDNVLGGKSSSVENNAHAHETEVSDAK